MARIPIVIAGGGIGGLAAALAISRGGLPVHVLEKSERFSEIGAGLQLAPNATRMLDSLGILDEVRKHATFPDRLVMMDAVSGEPITALDLRPKFVAHFGFPYILMHRGELLGAELAACQSSPRITLENNKEVVAVEDLGDGAAVQCGDGTIYECDLLIGADGLWSTVRKVVHDDGAPICAQFVAYRGTVPVDEAPPGADLRNMTIWVGPDMHFVQYVVKSGELFNQVAVFRSRRYREDSDDWGTVEELDEHYSRFCAPVREGSGKIGRGRRWAMYDRLPISNWTRNRITLLGDAAHPMLQYIAQGACQALEDAICLGEMLRRFAGDVPRALAAYQGFRIPRTSRVQGIARFFGEVKHVDGVGRALRNELLRRRAADDFEYCEWLYGGGAGWEPAAG